MRTCNKCQKRLRADQFYATSGSTCKECTKAAVKANRLLRRDHYVAYDRARAMRPDRVEAREEYARSQRGQTIIRANKERWADRNAFKRVAQWTLNNAVRDGHIKRQSCRECGAKAQAHHHDYSKPLDVIWLCPKHHKAEHCRMQRKPA